MKLSWQNPLNGLKKCIEKRKDAAEYKTMLYAADDFDDFIAFPKRVMVHDAEDLEDGEDKKFMQENCYKHLMVIECGKALKSSEIEFQKEFGEALDAVQLLNVLKKLEGKTCIRAKTEGGRIYFALAKCEFRKIAFRGDDKERSIFVLEGAF